MNIKDNNEPYFIDTHAHLDMIRQMTPEIAVKRSVEEGVRYIINVGSSLEGSRMSSMYSAKFDNVYAAVGIHPHHAGEQEATGYISLIEERSGQ